jgi:hypothetical protein
MVVVLYIKKVSIYIGSVVACWYLLCHFLDCSEINKLLADKLVCLVRLLSSLH